MDFVFNWLLGISTLFGMSHGELFYVASQIKNESPHEWRAAFFEHAENLANNATVAVGERRQELAAQYYLGAAYANKAALQFTDPATPDYSKGVKVMESTFLLGAKHLGAPIAPIDVPYRDTTLPAYYLKIDDMPRPILIMIGGGDTSREDLFYFAGYPGWKRGYNILMVDLPGQGNNPGRGLPFTAQTNEAVSASLDWIEKQDKHISNIAIYGVSGGGYFTAQAVEHDKRIKAWIASTPIYDIAEVFRKEFGAALKTSGWLMNGILKLAGKFNESADINLKKYAWQFGAIDFASAVVEVLKQAKPVAYDKITCPALFMMGENDGAELQRQTRALYDSLSERGLPVTMRVFTAEEGADAHCQVNNFRLAHLTVFDWLDATFNYKG